MRFPDGHQAFHVYARWATYAFDHSGWSLEAELVAVNSAFEKRQIETGTVRLSLADFCGQHWHRLPHQYWRDPVPGAEEYVRRFVPPWA